MGNEEREVGPVRSFGYKGLTVWQQARKLVKAVYEITQAFPPSELYGLTSQMRRAAVSVAANIAEGNARYSSQEYAQFISIARGSAAELETLFQLSADLGYVLESDMEESMQSIDEISRMLNKLRQSLKQVA